jgi:hypothetical protein
MARVTRRGNSCGQGKYAHGTGLATNLQLLADGHRLINVGLLVEWG